MFTKEDYIKWLDNRADKELNKKMVEEFPFLLPRNVWTGIISEDYNYSYNKLCALEEGWAKAFGYEMICEIRDSLKKFNYLNDYMVLQIKEKFGTLRWYDLGAPEETISIINKYCALSENICVRCGEPATHITSGWINYMCKDCVEKYKRKAMTIEDYNKQYED